MENFSPEKIINADIVNGLKNNLKKDYIENRDKKDIPYCWSEAIKITTDVYRSLLLKLV